MKAESEEKDWRQVIIDIVVTILTLGFSHIKKHKKNR